MLPVQIEQLNSLTAWVDASQVYGSSLEEANALRDHTDPDDFGRGICLENTAAATSYLKRAK